LSDEPVFEEKQLDLLASLVEAPRNDWEALFDLASRGFGSSQEQFSPRPRAWDLVYRQRFLLI
jgi:hypothetical protein